MTQEKVVELFENLDFQKKSKSSKKLADKISKSDSDYVEIKKIQKTLEDSFKKLSLPAKKSGP